MNLVHFTKLNRPMKLKKIPIILISLILLIGCNSKEKIENQTKQTIISGTIKNLNVYPDSKKIFAEVIDFRDRKSVFKDIINKDGSFKIILDLYSAQDIRISPLVNRLILHPEDSIFLQIDFGDIGNVAFSGDRAKTNKDLRQYLWSNAGTVSYYCPDKILPEKYKLYCDRLLKKNINLGADFILDKKPDDEVSIWINDYILINYYKSLFRYPRSYFKRDDEGYNEWLTTTTYFDFVDSIENVFSNYGHTIINSDIYDLLENYGFYMIQKSMRAKSNSRDYTVSQITNTIMENHNNTVFRQMVLGNLHYQFLCSNYVNEFDNSKDFLSSIIQTPFIREPLFYFYDNLKKNMENPEINSNAILSKMGIEGKLILDSIIADNKGKVLFVDLWATWCGPCIRGMNTAKEIMPQYVGKNIEFIFLCVSSKEKNWKATLSKLDIGGKHYFCNNNQSGDIRKALGVEGIPHYLMINKQGQIVESKCLDLKHSLNKIDKLLNEK